MTTDRDAASPRDARPPAWAEATLGLLLEPQDRECVSGDLREEYRKAIVPGRGARAGDRWYILQAGGFLWRATWIWALLFSGAFLARTAYDWLVPTTDFLLRSEVSTAFGVATLFSTACWAAWRSGSVVAGIFVAVVTSQVAAVISVVGASLMLAIWHDPHTQRAIVGSGGLGEVYVLPFMMVIPAVIVGTLGGAAGSLCRRLV
jgi:hypothetical protein